MALLRHVWHAEGGAPGTLSVVLADHATVLELNRAYLQHDYITDVLAFALSDDPLEFDGEIYIDLDTAAERHTEFGTTYEREACRYAVHGLLHLLGYDDHTPDGKAHMHVLEDQYLESLAID